MKRFVQIFLNAALIAKLSTGSLAAQVTGPATWHAESLDGALGNMSVFTIAGIALAIIGYKLFDHFTPGQLHKEIVENKNVAAAIIGAAVILGVCVIVAASIVG